jgi:hypothetical protein
MRRYVVFGCTIVLVASLVSTAAGSDGPQRGAWLRTFDRSQMKPTTPELGSRFVARGAVARGTGEPELRNFELVGHTDLGATDTNGDVWVHGDHAYVGTWGDPCNGLGVKVIDVSDPTDPTMIGRIGARHGTSAEDVVVRSVSTSAFTGDLAAIGIQRCGGGTKLDGASFGTQFWDVTDPADPQKLGSIGFSQGGGGTHELDLFQRGDHVYSLNAVPFTEFFDPEPAGDLRIVDVTDPADPVQLAAWGALEHGMTRGPWDGLGSFGAVYDHSVRASADGTKAYVSYWDLGVLTFDIADPTDPVLVGQTRYPFGADGDAHSLSEYVGGSRRFLLTNDEDTDPRSPAFIHYGEETAVASESPTAPPLWRSPEHAIAAPVVRARQQGCKASNYPAATVGSIAVVRTVFMLYDDPKTAKRQCRQVTQERAAEAAGAVAVVHDWISEATSPQWWTIGPVGIPVLFTDHDAATGMVAEGEARLEAQQPASGFLRVFDANTGEQVASFSDLPNVHAVAPPPGVWSIHNNEVSGDRAYASWYSHGIVALDLSPLKAAVPADPVLVGQFVPPVDPHAAWSGVWGVFVRESDGLIFASDFTSGLWIVRPTGDAAA